MAIQLQKFGYDLNELTIPQMELYTKAISQYETERDLVFQRELWSIIRLAMGDKEDNCREFLKKITDALRTVEHDRKIRFGYEFKGTAIKGKKEK